MISAFCAINPHGGGVNCGRFPMGYRLPDGTVRYHTDDDIIRVLSRRLEPIPPAGPIWSYWMDHHGWRVSFGYPPKGSKRLEGFPAPPCIDELLPRMRLLMSGKGIAELFVTGGKRHRTDGPAVIYMDGSVEYREHDRLHRLNAPAVVWYNGGLEYWVNNKRHREDGPALVWPGGIEEYWVNNKRHREDGPAVIYGDGTYDYWVNGERLRYAPRRRIVAS